MNDWKQELLRHYVRRGALATGRFQLTGGGTSDFYIDGRLVTTYPPALRVIARWMAEIVRSKELLCAGGNLVAPVLSGIPVVAAVALELDMSFVMDRGEHKQHGHAKRFEGRFTDSPNCLIIDDLITVASTLVKVVDGLRAIGKDVRNALVVVDREEGGRERLLDLGVTLHALVSKTELLAALRDNRDG
jgi:orotate phosphoribosyltransferase